MATDTQLIEVPYAGSPRIKYVLLPPAFETDVMERVTKLEGAVLGLLKERTTRQLHELTEIDHEERLLISQADLVSDYASSTRVKSPYQYVQRALKALERYGIVMRFIP